MGNNENKGQHHPSFFQHSLSRFSPEKNGRGVSLCKAALSHGELVPLITDVPKNSKKKQLVTNSRYIKKWAWKYLPKIPQNFSSGQTTEDSTHKRYSKGLGNFSRYFTGVASRWRWMFSIFSLSPSSWFQEKGLMTPIKSLLGFMCNFTNLIYNMALSCHDWRETS